jgi:hypothetical protein
LAFNNALVCLAYQFIWEEKSGIIESMMPQVRRKGSKRGYQTLELPLSDAQNEKAIGTNEECQYL